LLSSLGGGGWQGGFWLHVPSCLSYLRAMCFESYVGHSLTSEAAGWYSFLNGKCWYRMFKQVHYKFQVLSNWSWITIVSHWIWLYIIKNKQKQCKRHLCFMRCSTSQKTSLPIYSIPRVLSIFNLTFVLRGLLIQFYKELGARLYVHYVPFLVAVLELTCCQAAILLTFWP
jgi:hypothetical protein